MAHQKRSQVLLLGLLEEVRDLFEAVGRLSQPAVGSLAAEPAAS